MSEVIGTFTQNCPNGIVTDEMISEAIAAANRFIEKEQGQVLTAEITDGSVDWIRTTERIPEASGEYYVCFRDDDKVKTGIVNFKACDGPPDTTKVTHWTRMNPDPPTDA